MFIHEFHLLSYCSFKPNMRYYACVIFLLCDVCARTFFNHCHSFFYLTKNSWFTQIVTNHNDNINWIPDMLLSLVMLLQQVEKDFEKLTLIRSLLLKFGSGA